MIWFSPIPYRIFSLSSNVFIWLWLWFGKYDKDRADECQNEEDDEYNEAWNHSCEDGEYTEAECNGFKNNLVEIEDYDVLKNENDITCNEAGREDGKVGVFNEERNNGCMEYGDYKEQFQLTCENNSTESSCELLYEDKQYYCPNIQMSEGVIMWQ